MESNPITTRRVALLVQYDGTPFHGFQLQKNSHTVQAEIEQALTILTGNPVSVLASGRTDTGVHALGQVVHCDVTCDFPLRRIAVGLNGIMNRAVSVKDVYHVHDGFHSRFDARCREYRYLIYNHPYYSSFVAHRALWHPKLVDMDRINEACSYLIGEHDFTALSKPSECSSNRNIYSAGFFRDGDYLELRITANAFLHNMIRIIVGTMIMVNDNGLPPSYIREVIESGDRKKAGETVPPWGLYLHSITYDPPLSFYPSALKELESLGQWAF
jgi:tRNA pseudouridine38-40 synthase